MHYEQNKKNIMIGTPELILIVLALVLLFGAKKIPELMKGLGQGVKSFKDGMNGKIDETTEDKDKKKDE
ncbi:tatA/E family twin arginine-targeting protein translocase [Prevotella sp. CAG:1185]|nr:tatA/E family twin arginine-targeting protein translocase [Prevotella sp. CAG:1185]